MAAFSPVSRSTRSISVQCALGLQLKTTVRHRKVQCDNWLKKDTKSVAVQCAIRNGVGPNTQTDCCASRKPKTSSVAVQCGIVTGLPAASRTPVMVAAKTHIEPTTSILGDEFADVKVSMEITTSTVLREVCSIVEKYALLQYSLLDSHVEVTRKGWHGFPAIGLTPVRLCFYASGKAWLLPLFSSPQETSFMTANVIQVDVIQNLLSNLTPGSGYLFCEGIDVSSSGTHKDTPPNVEHFVYPCNRIQAKNCAGYYKAAPTAPFVNRICGTGRCTNCSLQQSTLKRKRNIEESVSSTRKIRRTLANSNYPITKLSPRSLRKRTINLSLKRKQHRQQMLRISQKLKPLQINLSPEQHHDIAPSPLFTPGNNNKD